MKLVVGLKTQRCFIVVLVPLLVFLLIAQVAWHTIRIVPQFVRLEWDDFKKGFHLYWTHYGYVEALPGQGRRGIRKAREAQENP